MTARERVVVAIDGPAGAGKSTVARGVAEALGYTLVDTGALYRAVALLARERGVDPSARADVEALAAGAVTSGMLRLDRASGTATRVLLAGEDPGPRLRTPDISMGASKVSAHPGVRAALLDAQRAFGAHGGVVLEGRDIGTVVFPDAEVKVFLTASPHERARRRHEELLARGMPSDFAATLAEVVQRDAQDEGRAVAPLRPAADAVHLDTDGLAPGEVVARILALVRPRGGPG